MKRQKLGGSGSSGKEQSGFAVSSHAGVSYCGPSIARSLLIGDAHQ